MAASHILPAAFLSIFGLLLAAQMGFVSSPSSKKAVQPAPFSRLKLNQAYGRLPLAFEPNQGQADSRVQYLSHGNGYTLFLASGEAVLVLHKPQAGPHSKNHKSKNGKKAGRYPVASAPFSQTPPSVLRMKLEGAQAGTPFQSLDQLPGISNYLIGNDRSQWHTNIPQYAGVQAREVYPGIDMVFYGNQGHLEYDFVVKPGADPKSIHLKYEGAQSARVNAQGDLELGIEGGLATFRSPAVYQENEGQRNPVEGRYRLEEGGGIRFEVKDYDKTRPLIIDPTLDYSTDFGGDAIAVDGNGNAYVTGTTTSNAFPTTPGASQGVFPGGAYTAFVFELNPAGSALVYCTYLGGNGSNGGGNGDGGLAIAVDGTGDARVAGYTWSTNFPTTPGALQTGVPNANQSAFVAELNPAGTGLVYSTYLGGNTYDQADGIALDGSGNAYVTGYTQSTNFPITSGAYQTSHSGQSAFVTELKPSAGGTAQLAFSTYLGGGNLDQGNGIALDGKGDIFVTGSTQSVHFPTTPGAFQSIYPPGADISDHSFVTELNPAGTGLVYSTFLGGKNTSTGTGGGVSDVCNAIAVDGNGDAYVTGYTDSTDFPTTSGAFQTSIPNTESSAFVTELNPAGTGLVYSTYLGGSDWEEGFSIAVDGSGDAYVTGTTWSPDFPLTLDALQTAHANVLDLAFLTEFNPAGTGLVYSTYFGGESLYDDSYGESIALDGKGGIYLAGYNLSSGVFPTTSGAYEAPCTFCGDANFVAKFQQSNPTAPSFTPTQTALSSPTVTPTLTTAATPSSSPSSTATRTSTPTPSNSPTQTPTATATPSPTHSATPTATDTLAAAFTDTPTGTPTDTATLSFSATSPFTATPTASWTSTAGLTPTPTGTSTATPTPTLPNNPTASPTPAPGVVIGPPYPNPVQSPYLVSIPVTAPPGSTVEWGLFTVASRKILDRSDPIAANHITLVWNLEDAQGNPVANGLYYIRVQVRGRIGSVKTLKVLVLR